MKPLLFLALAASAVSAAEPADPDAKLREALRTTATQLRTAQTDLANAQATTAAAEAKNKALEKQLADANAKLTSQVKQASEDRTASEQTIATLSKLADRDKRIKEYEEAIVKWKAAWQQATDLARTTDAQKTKLAAEAASLKNTVADRERRNIALFNTATEILDRYKNHALGKAILAKEPFTQTTRVKIETLVQGYGDKIVDNRIPAKP
jgi:uncharacterized protein (DUF3084 family)